MRQLDHDCNADDVRLGRSHNARVGGDQYASCQAYHQHMLVACGVGLGQDDQVVGAIVRRQECDWHVQNA